MTYPLIFLIGLAAGLLSGIFGVGGGIVIVPALVLLFKYTPESAVATSLGTLLPPVGLLAVLQYHQKGLVHWGAVTALALGYICSSWVGARIVTQTSVEHWHSRAFGVLLIVVGCRFLLK